MLHDVLDFFSLLVAILALMALFIDPTGKRRQLFLKIALAIATGVLLLYSSFTWWQKVVEHREYETQLKNKENLIVRTICREPEINYEQLYNETSQGFADNIPNDAIDELTQKDAILRTRWVNVPLPNSSRSLTVRLYYVDPNSCGSR
jgi:hypothetical protein